MAFSKDDPKSETQPIFRRLFATVTNNEFSAFLVQARHDGWTTEDDRIDIQGAMDHLVRNYGAGRVVILKAHALAEAKDALAKAQIERGEPYGTEKVK